MTDKLLPCPFCGGEAAFDHDDNGWNWIVCLACDTSTTARVSTMDDCRPLLAEAWNRRLPMKLVAWRYWKDKFGCWEYSDTPIEFPAVPAGTKLEALLLASETP